MDILLTKVNIKYGGNGKMLEIKTYKNYKELCEAIGWKISTGNGKKAQLKELEKVCRYHKEGNKIIVDEIFLQPKIITDNRQESYISLIENLILNLCYNESYQPSFDGSIKVSMSRIARGVGLFNANFSACKRMLGKTSKYLGTNIDTTKEYFDTVERSASGKIETALKNLDKKATISWNKVIMVAEVEEFSQFSHREKESGKTEIYKSTMENHRKATDEEIDFIRDSRKEAYILYNVKDAKQAKFSSKAKEINNDIKTRLLKRNIAYYYYAYEIRFNPKFVEYDLKQFYLDEDEKYAMTKTLKEAFSIKIYENADKKNVKCIGRPNNSDKKAYRKGNKYLEDYQTLNDNMIIKDKSILDEVYKTHTDSKIEEMLEDISTEELIKLIEKRQSKK